LAFEVIISSSLHEIRRKDTFYNGEGTYTLVSVWEHLRTIQCRQK